MCMCVCVCVCVCVGRGCAYNMPGMSAIILKLPAHRGLAVDVFKTGLHLQLSLMPEKHT